MLFKDCFRRLKRGLDYNATTKALLPPSRLSLGEEIEAEDALADCPLACALKMLLLQERLVSLERSLAMVKRLFLVNPYMPQIRPECLFLSQGKYSGMFTNLLPDRCAPPSTLDPVYRWTPHYYWQSCFFGEFIFSK